MCSAAACTAARETWREDTRAVRLVRRLTHERELVRGVESRDLVALGQRRVVEDRSEEVIESAAERDHGLSDVNQLRGAAADAVAAEQLAAVLIEQHLEHALFVAANRAARDLLVARDAALVRDLLRGELLFRGADH